jgi:hypothetical protein
MRRKALYGAKEKRMRRIHLPNEDEHGWSYDPGSIEHLIEAHLRHEETERKRLREWTAAGESRLPLKSSKMGLNEVELDGIWLEGWILFLESASLSDELRDERERFRATFPARVERFLKNPDREISDLAERHAVWFALACEGAIKRATGEFADLLTQAVIARRGRKDFPLTLRTEMWAECLRFSMKLARFEAAGVWVDKAWGFAPYESCLPHLHRLDTIALQQAEAAKFSSKFKAKFEDRIRHGSPQWLDEAERRIQLRTLLSSAPQRRAGFDDPSKLAVTNLLFRTPDLRAEQICAKLDAANERGGLVAPIPNAWQKRGARSWLEAYARFPGNVRAYISKVRNEAGMPRNRHD